MGPVIAVSASRQRARWTGWDGTADVLIASYADALVAAGAVPVVLPPVGAGQVAALARVDALVLSGGADVAPARYGATAHPLTGPAQPARDETELALTRAALAAGLPLLAICRGAQLLNVALGGDLIQDLSELPGSRPHQDGPGRFETVAIRLDPASRLARLLGDQLEGRCQHHQAVGRLADGLVAVGWSPDGVVEAVEVVGRPLSFGVQWHPEEQVGGRLIGSWVAAVGAGAPVRA